MDTIRAFIAIELPVEIQLGIEEVVKRLSSKGGTVRWVQPRNIHLTLKFLGEITPAELSRVKSALKAEVGQCNSFAFQVEGIGVFPNAYRPRVVWVGVKAPVELSALYQRVEEGCQRVGFGSEERGFTPHLTMGRVNQSAKPEDALKLGELVKSTVVGRLGEVKVDAICLFRSTLTPGGAVYTLIERFNFGKNGCGLC